MTNSILSRKKKPQKSGVLLRVGLPLLFWLGLWCVLAELIGQELLVPTPWRVLSYWASLALTAEFGQSVLASLLRIFCGGAFGALLGVVLAVLCRKSAVIDMLLSPMIKVVRATPVAGFIILLLLWLKVDTVPTVVAGLMVLPIVWESVCAGLGAVDQSLLEFAGAYQMSHIRTLRYIYLPTLKPHLSAALATSVGLAWKSGVAAEVLCLPKLAIGSNVYFAKIYLETPSLFAWCLTVVVLSLLIERLVLRLLKFSR